MFDIDGSPDKAKFQTFPTKCTLTNSYGTVPQASGHIATLKAKTVVHAVAPALRVLAALPEHEGLVHARHDAGARIPPTDPAPFNYTRAINYRTEPLDYRFPDPDWLDNFDILAPIGISRALSNAIVLADPQTPVFAARAGTPIRFRMVHPAGINEQVFTLHGHVWQEEPYINGSRQIGNNPLSQSQGSRDGFGANVAFDAVIDKAGGAGGVPGDYLYRTFIGERLPGGDVGPAARRRHRCRTSSRSRASRTRR